MAKVEEGSQAPEFELPGTGGKTYRLADHRGRWVVLAFYPADFTTVCTKQFRSYRDNAGALARLDADVLGISPQGVESHERFTAEHDLNVPLLADEDREVAGAYGVLGPKGFVRRSIFVVDPDGIVRFRHVSRVGLSFKTVEEIDAELSALRQAA